MSEDDDFGFGWTLRKDCTLVISRAGRAVSERRGDAARTALSRLEAAGDAAGQQHVMARLTGNYRRGNERQGKGG